MEDVLQLQLLTDSKAQHSTQHRAEIAGAMLCASS